MGERKVLNRYPPDFDPAKLPRGKREKDNAMKVRMMLPMTVRCTTCGTYMYKGTKFNMQKEDVAEDNYLGIQIFRFYWRCSRCSAEITMKTDPKNSDYSTKFGATRNYEPWRDNEKMIEEAIRAREEEEKGNAIKALENRTLDNKREMDVMTALDEMMSLKARHEKVDVNEALAAVKRSAAKEEEDGMVNLKEEDDAAVRGMLLTNFQTTRHLTDSGERAAFNMSEPGAADASMSQQARPATKRGAWPKPTVVAKRRAPEAAGVPPPAAKRPAMRASQFGSGVGAGSGGTRNTAVVKGRGGSKGLSQDGGCETGGLEALLELRYYGSEL